MAYESFAQARITGEPGRKFQLRGGGVKIGDIPNLPKVDTTMRPANYPDIPSIRHSKMDLGGQDWSRRAGQLQQENLPGSFERGAARMAAAAGDAEFKMGTAISRGSQAVAGGLSDLAGGLNKIQAHLDHETTKSMAAKEDNAYDIAKSAFDVRVQKEGIPAANYQKEFWGPGGEGENYRNYVETLKPTNSWSSRTVTDELESRVAGREAGFTVHANTQLANELHSSNVEAHKFRFENALKENRFDDARTAMNDARAANTINDGQVERMKSEIKTQEDKWFADAIINTKVDPNLAYESKEKGGKVPGPALAMQEAQKVLDAKEGHEKGASAIFPNIDKVEARRILDLASKQFADNEKNDVSNLTRRALAGNATEEQIRKESKILGFDNQTTDGIVKVVKEARPYDDGTVGEIYKVLTATDFKNPETALADRRKIEQMIFDGADKRSADILLTELGKKWDKRDEPSTIQEEEVKGANDLITATFEHQLTEAKKKSDKSELASLNKKRMDAYKEVERFKEANPEFDSGKLHEHIVDYLQPERQKESQKAVNAQTTPVDIRPYSGGTTTQAPAGPAYGTPEWYAKQKEMAMQKEKPAAAPAPRTQVGGGYVVGEVSPEMPESVGTSGAPTPYVPPIPSAPPGSSGAPTPLNVPRVAPPETVSKPAQPPVAVTRTGEAASYSHIGGKLSGKQDMFTAAANRYGVDPHLLMAISAHETGNGTSEFLTKHNNPGGLMDPKTNWEEPQKFATLEEGIDAMARNLKEKYLDRGLTTIEAIAEVYAPTKMPDGSPVKNDPRGWNKLWPDDVKAIYAQLKGEVPAGQPGETTRTAQAVSFEGIDERSRKNISTLKPEAQKPIADFMAKAIKWGNERGVKIVVTEGYRSPERQSELYAQGRTKPGKIVTNAKAGQSRHQSARAVDVAIIKNGKVLEGKEYDKMMKELGKMGVAMGLEWGGNFKSIYDPDHFQYNG